MEKTAPPPKSTASHESVSQTTRSQTFQCPHRPAPAESFAPIPSKKSVKIDTPAHLLSHSIFHPPKNSANLANQQPIVILSPRAFKPEGTQPKWRNWQTR